MPRGVGYKRTRRRAFRRRRRRFRSKVTRMKFQIGFQHPKLVIQNGLQEFPRSDGTLARQQLPWGYSYAINRAAFNITSSNPVLIGYPINADQGGNIDSAGLPDPSEPIYGIIYPLRFLIMPTGMLNATLLEYNYFRIRRISYVYSRLPGMTQIQSNLFPYTFNVTRSKVTDPIFTLEAFRALPHFRRKLYAGRKLSISWRPTVESYRPLLNNENIVVVDPIETNNFLAFGSASRGQLVHVGKRQLMPWVATNQLERLFSDLIQQQDAIPVTADDIKFGDWYAQLAYLTGRLATFSGPTVCIQTPYWSAYDDGATPPNYRYMPQVSKYAGNPTPPIAGETATGAIVDGTDLQVVIKVQYEFKGRLKKKMITYNAMFCCWPGGLPVQSRTSVSQSYALPMVAMTTTTIAPINNGAFGGVTSQSQQTNVLVPHNDLDFRTDTFSFTGNPDLVGYSTAVGGDELNPAITVT